jgi:hypothetical protein
MYKAPPAGAQVIGILNILFGVLGAFPWLLVLLGGGALALLGGAAATQGGDAAVGGGVVGAVGGLVMLLAVVGMALSALLLASGIGVLKLAPWGRTLGLVYAIAALVLNVVNLFVSGFASLPCNLLALVYPIVLLVVLNQQDWKDAFS